MCFRGEGKLTQALLISRRVTLAYCVSAVQSSTMVGDPSRVRYVTVDICSHASDVEGAGGSTRQGNLRVYVDANIVYKLLVCRKSKGNQREIKWKSKGNQRAI